jgi:hypothetical protein
MASQNKKVIDIVCAYRRKLVDLLKRPGENWVKDDTMDYIQLMHPMDFFHTLCNSVKEIEGISKDQPTPFQELAEKIKKRELELDEAFRDFLDLFIDDDKGFKEDFTKIQLEPKHRNRFYDLLQTMDQIAKSYAILYSQ